MDAEYVQNRINRIDFHRILIHGNELEKLLEEIGKLSQNGDLFNTGYVLGVLHACESIFGEVKK